MRVDGKDGPAALDARSASVVSQFRVPIFDSDPWGALSSAGVARGPAAMPRCLGISNSFLRVGHGSNRVVRTVALFLLFGLFCRRWKGLGVSETGVWEVARCLADEGGEASVYFSGRRPENGPDVRML